MTKKNKEKLISINNPFSLLKGLSVSAHQKNGKKKEPLETPSCPAPSSEPLSDPLSDPSLEPIDEVALFEQAMGELGVSQTTQDDVLEKVTAVPPAALDTLTGSELLAVQNQPASVSRRQARKLVQRIGEPQATLDLHGVAAADVERKLGHFLENAAFHGCRSVRIVTGKGTHSAVGPVLRPLVEAYLAGIGRQFVTEWTRAPLQHGGAGALLVLLRQ